MSISASIDLAINTTISPLILTIIRILLAAGWGFKYEQFSSYLPLGDNDDFDWKIEKIEDINLLEILAEKEKSGELIGVAMVWKNTGSGGTFLFHSDGSISISLSINRKKIEEKFTDVNWYIDKLISPLIEAKIIIESFVFSEHI